MIEKKNTHGGARRIVGPRGKVKTFTTSLYQDEVDFIRDRYGSLAKGLRSLPDLIAHNIKKAGK